MSIWTRAFKSSWNVEEFPKYPRISKKDFIKWNEEMFKKYNNERVYCHPNPLIAFVEKRRVDALLNMLVPLKKTDSVLAAGCGEGYIEEKIPSCKLALVDISLEAIERAKKKLKQRKNTTFYIQNLEKLSFSAKFFDKIECSEVIEHVLSPEDMMKEFNRVLKSEGCLVISFPNEPLINFIKKIFIRLKMFNLFFPNVPRNMVEEWHLHSFDLNRFKEITDGSWEILMVKGAPFSFFPLRYVAKCKKLS